MNGNGNGNGNGTSATAVAPAKPREIRVVEDHGPLANMLDTARFEHMYRIAQTIAASTLTPKHLMGNSPQEAASNCFRVVNQAVRWGMDPFAVIDETYVVSGKLGYQGKLVIAVINARAGLKGRLNFTYSGSGDGRTVTVSGTFEGETEPRSITLTVEQGKTANKMWKDDPDQKLAYSGATKWARRHAPEVMLGVLTEEDLERISEARAAQPPIPANARISANDAALTDQDRVQRDLDNSSDETDAKGEIKTEKPEPAKEPAKADDAWLARPVADLQDRIGLSRLSRLKHVGIKTLGELRDKLEIGDRAALGFTKAEDFEHVKQLMQELETEALADREMQQA